MCVSNQPENHSVFITNYYHPAERKKVIYSLAVLQYAKSLLQGVMLIHTKSS